jgi:hypothetical protein
VRADDAIDGDAAILLEGAHGTIEFIVEPGRITVGDVEAEALLGKAGSHLCDSRAFVAKTKSGCHGRA